MPIPFDMIAVMLFLGFYVARPDTSPPTLTWSALILLGFAVGTSAIAYAINHLALAFIRKRAVRYSDRRQAAAISDITLRCILVALFALGLTESSFPWRVAASVNWNLSNTLLPQMIGLLVYFVFFVCAWMPFYRLHREITPGIWTRKSFLIHKARYSLFMLVAWIPFALFSEWLSKVLFFLPLAFVVAAWTFPYFLTKLWGCKPLESGMVLGLVNHLESQTGTRFSKVLLWEPGGGRMQNAAAVGLFRPFRYLFLTPALVANMNREELRGVILHELGHIKKRHLLFYMVTTLAGVNSAVLLGSLLPVSGDIETFAIITLLIFFYFRFVFGWLSRNMERQADLYALEISGSAAGLISALEKLGIAAGNIRNMHSWHHLGIAERTTFLRHAEAEPAIAYLHNRKSTRIMLAGYFFSLFLLIGLGVALHDELTTTFPPSSSRRGEAEAHWQRVMRLLPSSAVGPLELAYHLATDPANKEQAIALANKAITLASTKEERDAAEKLIEDLSWEAL